MKESKQVLEYTANKPLFVMESLLEKAYKQEYPVNQIIDRHRIWVKKDKKEKYYLRLMKNGIHRYSIHLQSAGNATSIELKSEMEALFKFSFPVGTLLLLFFAFVLIPHLGLPKILEFQIFAVIICIVDLFYYFFLSKLLENKKMDSFMEDYINAIRQMP